MALSKQDRAFIRRVAREESRTIVAAMYRLFHELTVQASREEILHDMTRLQEAKLRYTS